MSQRNLDSARTLHGYGHLERSPLVGGSSEASFVPIGARVGGSGQVFETDGGAGPGRLVVKLFTWGAGLPEEVVQDFTREALAVASLRHPHIVQVVDAGTLGDGTPFVAMERLAGVTLDEAAGGRPLPIAEVLAVLRGVGSALTAAHAAGVAHGEVRADNVFIAEPAGYGPAWPLLLDFGVARLTAGARAIGRAVEGPLPQAAPPRLDLGGRAGARADQLALAALAWRLLGGLSAPAVHRVLFRAMSPDPSQRFSTVAAFVEAVEEASVIPAAPSRPPVGAAPSRPPVGAAPSRPPVVTAPGPSAVVAPQTAPAAAKPPVVAPTPAVASAPSSLTQQFFAEGDQMDEAHASGPAPDAGAGVQADEADEEDALPKAAASRLPRSRAQMAAAALLALGSIALIAWTVVSLADEPAGGLPAVAAPAAAPAGAPDRPVVVSPAHARPAPGSIERGPRGTTAQARRAPRVHPPPFPAASAPSVTTVEAPRPWLGGAPLPPATAAPPAPATAAPVASPSPPPDPAPPATESEPTKPLPDVAPTTSNSAATETQEPDAPPPSPSPEIQ
jgi:serine/threonine-protein kinase